MSSICTADNALVTPYLQAKEEDRPQPEGASSESPPGQAAGILHLATEAADKALVSKERDLEEAAGHCPAETATPDTLDTRIVMGEETSCSNEEAGSVSRGHSIISEYEETAGDTLDEATMYLCHPKAGIVEENSEQESDDEAIGSESPDDLHFGSNEMCQEYVLRGGLFSQGEAVADVPSFLKPTKEPPSSTKESDVQSLPVNPACSADTDPYSTAPSTPIKSIYSQFKHYSCPRNPLQDDQVDIENDNMSSPPTSPSGSYFTAEGGSWGSSATSSGSPSYSPNLMGEGETVESPSPYPDHVMTPEEIISEGQCCMSPDMLEDEDIPELYDQDLDPDDFSPENEEFLDGYPSDGHSSVEDEDEWETDFAPSFTSIPLCPEFINAGTAFVHEAPQQASCSSDADAALQPANPDVRSAELSSASLPGPENDHMIPAFMLPFRGSLIFEAESMEITLFPQGESVESEVIHGEEGEEDDNDDSTSASYLHSLSETSINEGVDESFAYQDDTSESSDSASYDGEEDEKRYSTEQYAVTTDAAPHAPEASAKSQHDSSNSGCESEMETSSDMSETDEECAVFTALDINCGDVDENGEKFLEVSSGVNEDSAANKDEEELNSDEEHDEGAAPYQLAQDFPLSESKEACTIQDSSSELEDSSTSNAPQEPIRSTLVVTSEAEPHFESPDGSQRLEKRHGAIRTWSDSPVEPQSTSSSEMDLVLKAGIGNVGECLIACFDTDEELDSLPPLNTTSQSLQDEGRGESGRQTSMAVRLAEDGNYFTDQREEFEEDIEKPESPSEENATCAHFTADSEDLEQCKIMEEEMQATMAETVPPQEILKGVLLEDAPEEECLFACYDSGEDPEDVMFLDRTSLLAEIYRQQEEAATYISNQTSCINDLKNQEVQANDIHTNVDESIVEGSPDANSTLHASANFHERYHDANQLSIREGTGENSEIEGLLAHDINKGSFGSIPSGKPSKAGSIPIGKPSIDGSIPSGKPSIAGSIPIEKPSKADSIPIGNPSRASEDNSPLSNHPEQNRLYWSESRAENLSDCKVETKSKEVDKASSTQATPGTSQSTSTSDQETESFESWRCNKHEEATENDQIIREGQDTSEKCPSSLQPEIPLTTVLLHHQMQETLSAQIQTSVKLETEESKDKNDYPVCKEPPDRESGFYCDHPKLQQDHPLDIEPKNNLEYESHLEIISENKVPAITQPEHKLDIELLKNNSPLSDSYFLGRTRESEAVSLESKFLSLDHEEPSIKKVAKSLDKGESTQGELFPSRTSVQPNAPFIERLAEKDLHAKIETIKTIPSRDAKDSTDQSETHKSQTPLKHNVDKNIVICAASDDVSLPGMIDGSKEDTTKTPEETPQLVDTEPASSSISGRDVHPRPDSALFDVASKPQMPKVEMSRDIEEMRRMLQGSFGKTETFDQSLRCRPSETIRSLPSAIEVQDRDETVVSLATSKVKDGEFPEQDIYTKEKMKGVLGKEKCLDKSTPSEGTSSEKFICTASGSEKTGGSTSSEEDHAEEKLDAHQKLVENICCGNGLRESLRQPKVYRTEQDRYVNSSYSSDVRTSKKSQSEQLSGQVNYQVKMSEMDYEYRLSTHVTPHAKAVMSLAENTPDTIKPRSPVSKVPPAKALSPMPGGSPHDQKVVKPLAAPETLGTKKLSSGKFTFK